MIGKFFEFDHPKKRFSRQQQMFAHKTEEYRQYMKSIEDRETHMSKLNMQLEQLESEKGGYESELGSSMASQLTENEHNELKNLNIKIQETAKEFENVANKRIDIEKKKNRIETLLSENLCKREEQLKRNMEQLEDAERKSKLTEALDSYKRLEFQTKDIQDREEQIRVSIKDLLPIGYQGNIIQNNLGRFISIGIRTKTTERAR